LNPAPTEVRISSIPSGERGDENNKEKDEVDFDRG
jgi:hypothetical protein